MKKLLFVSLLLTIYLSACKNNEEELNVADVLASGVWKGDKARAEIVGASNTLTFFSLADLPTDSTTDLTGATIEFRADGTFTSSPQGSFVEEGVEGTWELLENNSKIRLEGLNVSIESPPDVPGLFEINFSNIWKITNISSTNLTLSNTAQTTVKKELLEEILPPELVLFAQDLEVVMEVDVEYFR